MSRRRRGGTSQHRHATLRPGQHRHATLRPARLTAAKKATLLCFKTAAYACSLRRRFFGVACGACGVPPAPSIGTALMRAATSAVNASWSSESESSLPCSHTTGSQSYVFCEFVGHVDDHGQLVHLDADVHLVGDTR